MALFPGSQKKLESSFKISYLEPGVQQRLSAHLSQILSGIPRSTEIVVVCVGTDRSTGDALGPLVGRYLQQRCRYRFPLYGTIDQPVHAVNLKETLEDIEKRYNHPFVIGIDACLGQHSSVGLIQIGHGPVKPGAGVNKDLPPVGDIHMTGIVNVGGFMEYFVLQNTRLSLVINMAEIMAEALFASLLHLRSPNAMPWAELD